MNAPQNQLVLFVNSILCKASLTEGKTYKVQRTVGNFFIILADNARFVKVNAARFRPA